MKTDSQQNVSSVGNTCVRCTLSTEYVREKDIKICMILISNVYVVYNNKCSLRNNYLRSA